MRRQLQIARVKRHHLDSHRFARRRHDAEEAAMLSENTAQWLLPFPRRKFRQDPAHGVNQILDPEKPPNFIFVEVIH
jgi:hypothetical protein